MSARDAVLARVRRAVDRDAGTTAEARTAAADARLAAAGMQVSPTPSGAAASGTARQERFEAELREVSAPSSRLPSLPALAAQLRHRDLPRPNRMSAEPGVADLDGSGTEVAHGPGRLEDPATLSRAFAASAETGALALRRGPDDPATPTVLGEAPVAVIRASEVHAGLDEVWDRLREQGALPRRAKLATGPSRSADIGDVLQLGDHGPAAPHVFVVEGERP
ncbi:MAG: LUD domain-containing protein [Pseudomonadota bacterium]